MSLTLRLADQPAWRTLRSVWWNEKLKSEKKDPKHCFAGIQMTVTLSKSRTEGASGADVLEPELTPRLQQLLRGPLVSTLVIMAWPNILVMLAQASTGLIETFWMSRLGVAALTGMAIVFPGYMMMSMLSGGAIGGGISSAIARTLGSGRTHDAESLAVHAIIINAALGILTSAVFLGFGREIYKAMGGQGTSLQAALAYSNVIFIGNVALWVANALANIIRGTGNMWFPSATVCVSVAILIPLSPVLIFGFGVIPPMGLAGGGLAVMSTTVLMAIVLGWYVFSGRSGLTLKRTVLNRAMFMDILSIGGLATLNTLQTTLTVALTTALVGRAAGPDAVAGYGTGARLEYLLIPLVFGLGAPLVALVGVNVGARQYARALRAALIGGLLAFVLTEAIGVTAAVWPEAWLRVFGGDPRMILTGSDYLRCVGPAYGFFGLGLSLYFASQGAGRLTWPLCAGALRMAIAVGGGWVAWRLTGSLTMVFLTLGAALIVYGSVIAGAVASGTWFRASRQ
jgi:putative MATE family efflux protein